MTNDWLRILDADERKERIGADLERFVAREGDAWCLRFNPGLKKALVEKLGDTEIVKLIFQLADEQHGLERTENEERQNRLRMWQEDVDLDTKMCENDERILEKLDLMLEHQQAELQQQGVPAFRVTKNTREIELQMKILQFVLSTRN